MDVLEKVASGAMRPMLILVFVYFSEEINIGTEDPRVGSSIPPLATTPLRVRFTKIDSNSGGQNMCIRPKSSIVLRFLNTPGRQYFVCLMMGEHNLMIFYADEA